MTSKREKLWDYFILCCRVLIAWTFLRYGWSKLIDEQFGLTNEQLRTPVRDLSFFRLSWYLFDQQPFKAFIGISQIIAGLLLLYNRTIIFGALISIPILLNILIIDITYVKMEGFYWRLSYYLILDFLILWHYKDRIVSVFKIFYGTTTRFKYPLWAYFILPIMAVLLEILGVIPRIITRLITDPSQTLNQLGHIPNAIGELIKKIFN